MFKEFPIFGAASEHAATAAIAVKRAGGDYVGLYRDFMAARPLDDAAIDRILRRPRRDAEPAWTTPALKAAGRRAARRRPPPGHQPGHRGHARLHHRRHPGARRGHGRGPGRHPGRAAARPRLTRVKTDAAIPPRASRWPEVFAVFLRLGLTSFGGPIAHLGYFRAGLRRAPPLARRGGFGELVALCQFLPGPASSQVGLRHRPDARRRRWARSPPGSASPCPRPC